MPGDGLCQRENMFSKRKMERKTRALRRVKCTMDEKLLPHDHGNRERLLS